MKVVKTRDVLDVREEKTIYTVELDDGRTVDVAREHYPRWDSRPIIYVMDPHDDDIDCGAVLDFLRKTHEDFPSYRLKRKHRSAYKAVTENCYSREQAFFLAKMYMDAVKPEDIEVLCVYRNDVMVKDFLSPSV